MGPTTCLLRLRKPQKESQGPAWATKAAYNDDDYYYCLIYVELHLDISLNLIYVLFIQFIIVLYGIPR